MANPLLKRKIVTGYVPEDLHEAVRALRDELRLCGAPYSDSYLVEASLRVGLPILRGRLLKLFPELVRPAHDGTDTGAVPAPPAGDTYWTGRGTTKKTFSYA